MAKVAALLGSPHGDGSRVGPSGPGRVRHPSPRHPGGIGFLRGRARPAQRVIVEFIRVHAGHREDGRTTGHRPGPDADGDRTAGPTPALTLGATTAGGRGRQPANPLDMSIGDA